jgi:hypothetical protein
MMRLGHCRDEGLELCSAASGTFVVSAIWLAGVCIAAGASEEVSDNDDSRRTEERRGADCRRDARKGRLPAIEPTRIRTIGIKIDCNRVRGLAGEQSIGSVDKVDHAMWPLARWRANAPRKRCGLTRLCRVPRCLEPAFAGGRHGAEADWPRSAAPDFLSVGSRLLRQHEHRRIGRGESNTRSVFGQLRCTDAEQPGITKEQPAYPPRLLAASPTSVVA